MPSSRTDSTSFQARKADGRDHLTLAEFPISVLQRQQPTGTAGEKLDTLVFTASRYDRQAGKRVPQTVTLTTNSKAGLPTPADENVILAQGDCAILGNVA